MRTLLLLLTAVAAIGATPGPAQPSRERGPSPRDAQKREVRPEAERQAPGPGAPRPGFRQDRGEPRGPMASPQGPQAFGPRNHGGFPDGFGPGSALRERMMERRMEWMQRMRSHGMAPGHRPDVREFRRPGPEGRHQGPGFAPGRGPRPQGSPQFRGPSQFQGPRPGMNSQGPDRRPSVGQERGRPDTGRERGPQPAPEARGRAPSGPENDSPEVKKAREALEKARRALAEADERYDKAVQNARKKPSSEKKPDKPDDKKRPDKGR
ncbi:MAG: hypothetical protein ACKOY8_06260 [Verrucomicrobiota bacterium]